MGVLGRFFGKKATKQATAAPPPPCIHTQLAPRWAEAADMGDESKASEWACVSCNARFSPEEAKALREREAALLKEKLATPDAPAETTTESR